MKINSEQIDRLLDHLMSSYLKKELVLLKSNEAIVKSKIKAIIKQNFHEEEIIEEEARRMLDSHIQVTKDMDMHKMFLLTKQRLARNKGFVL